VDLWARFFSGPIRQYQARPDRVTESRVGANSILFESVWNDDAIRQLRVGPRRNLEEMLEEAYPADSLILSGDCKLMQWSVIQGKVT
jgi:hypothetical protein